MPFSMNEPLNPVPAPVPASDSNTVMDSSDPSSAFFAPELFQSVIDAPIPQDALAVIAQSAATALEDSSEAQPPEEPKEHEHGLDGTPVKQEQTENHYPSLDEDDEEVDQARQPSLTEDDGQRHSEDPSAKSISRPKNPGKSKHDHTAVPKSSVHSSKNEGQHTDRRYLCYICNKLFTRRRSVRDHISKIHNTKTWEPVRSLEIIVNPITGEPDESLDDIIARGPPPPPPKAPKPDKSITQDHDRESEPPELGNKDPVENIQQPVQQPPTPSRDSPRPATTVSTLKKEPSISGSRASSTEPFATPAQIAGKKRPAPIESSKPSSAASKKKGLAKPKPSPATNKRTKLNDSEPSPSYARSNPRSPSVTPSTQLKPLPNSKLRTQNSAASVKSSPTPASSRAASRDGRSISPSSSVADTPTSSNDDGEVFCICRKGDNHTWMIACDGGCEEWFHGNCVSIKERDGELIDKYICPTCMKPDLHTTWKRMCRRKDCRKPARVMQDAPSKYCSDACGRMFFVELVQRGDPVAQSSRDGQFVLDSDKSKKLRKKSLKKEKRHNLPKAVIPLVSGEVADLMNDDSRLATPAYSEDEKTDYETDSSLDDDMLPNRAGALRAGEVRALATRCQTIDDWRNLGQRPHTPPRDVDMMDADPAPLAYDELELAKITIIKAQKEKYNTRNVMLSARETFLNLVKARSATITEEVKKANPKGKEVCGFDPRLAWCEEEFSRWYNERGGKAILDAGPNARIGPPDEEDLKRSRNIPNSMNDHHGMMNGISADEDKEEKKMPKKGGVCIVKNCARHKTWAKAQLAEVRFEQDLARRAMSKLEAEEGVIRQRAMVRGWERRG